MAKTSVINVDIQGVDNRQRILEAALEVIRTKGVDGLTHRAIAAQAGVSLGLTTYYFKDLEEIIEESFDLAMKKDTDFLLGWYQNLQKGADVPEELTRLVFSYLETQSENVYVYFVLVLAAVHRKQLQKKANEWASFMTNLFAQNFSAEAAIAIATIYDGTLLRQAITGNVGTHNEIKEGFERACGEEKYLKS